MSVLTLSSLPEESRAKEVREPSLSSSKESATELPMRALTWRGQRESLTPSYFLLWTALSGDDSAAHEIRVDPASYLLRAPADRVHARVLRASGTEGACCEPIARRIGGQKQRSSFSVLSSPCSITKGWIRRPRTTAAGTLTQTPAELAGAPLYAVFSATRRMCAVEC